MNDRRGRKPGRGKVLRFDKHNVMPPNDPDQTTGLDIAAPEIALSDLHDASRDEPLRRSEDNADQSGATDRLDDVPPVSLPDAAAFERERTWKAAMDAVELPHGLGDYPADEAQAMAVIDHMLRGLDDVRAELGAAHGAREYARQMTERRWGDVIDRLQRKASVLESAISDLAAMLPQRGKSRTRTLAHGSLGYRKLPERFDVIDEAALHELVAGTPDLDVVFPQPPAPPRRLSLRGVTDFVTRAARRLSKAPGGEIVVTETGESIGVRVVPERDKLYINTDHEAPK